MDQILLSQVNVRKNPYSLVAFIEPEYYVLEYPDWVNVIAITDDGMMILEKQYRHGIGCAAWEIPCGVLEKSDSSPLSGAQRELLEETGYGGGEWTLLDTLSGNPCPISLYP